MARAVDSEVQLSNGETSRLAIWQARIEKANRLWSEYRRSLDPYYNAYQGVFKAAESNPDYIGVPLAFSHAKFRIPSLYLKDPFYKVKARTPFSIESAGDQSSLYGDPSQSINPEGVQVRDNVMGAEIVQNALNYEVKQMGLKWQAKYGILDALFAYSFLKVGYDTEWTYSPVQSPVAALTVPQGEDAREGLEWNETVKRESVWAMRVSPWDFRYDTDIKMLDPWLSQCRWIAFRNIRPLADVKADPLYKNTGDLDGTLTDIPAFKGKDLSNQVDADAESPIPGPVGEGVSPKDKVGPQEKFVLLWEIWDKKEKKILVFAEGHDKFLRDDDWPFDLDGFPGAFLHFHDVPDKPFPMSDFASWFDQNLAINTAESMDLESMKRRIDKVIYNKGSIANEDADQLTESVTKAFVPVGDINGFKELKSSPANSESATVIARADRRVYELSGVSGEQRGSNSSDTATQAAIIQTNVDARQKEMEDRVKDWMTCIGYKLIGLMKQFFTKERIVPIIGREDAEWIPYTKDNIQGDYDLDVTLSPYNPHNPEVAVKQLSELLMLSSRMPMIPDGQGGMVGINVAAIFTKLLENMPIPMSASEILLPSPSGMGGLPGQPGMPGTPSSPDAQAAGGPPGGGAQLPGEGSGADKKSFVASQGTGQAAFQAMRQRGMDAGMGGMLAGSQTPSAGR